MDIRGHRFVGGSMLAACSFFIFASSASAASPRTRDFFANLVPNVDFLDRSSRFALQNSKNARLKEFARSEAREQTLAANAIDEWKEGDQPAPPALSAKNLDRTPTGSTRQRGVPAPTAPVAQPIVDDRLPMGQEDLDRLEGLEGPEFDAVYKEKQRDALGQVVQDYEAYIEDGDVAALKALAIRELPRIRRRQAQLAKL